MINRASKFLKTDLSYIAKSGSWITLNNVVSALASFLLLIAFGNLLPKNSYGTYQYILSIAGLLSIPTLNGINTSLIQSVSKGYGGSFKKALGTKIRWGLLGGLCSLILSGYYFINDNSTLSICFLIAAAFVPLMDPLKLYDSLLSGKKLFKTISLYGILINIFRATSLIIGLLLTKNIILIVLIYFISNTILRTIFLIITMRKFPQEYAEKDPETISYGKHLSFINILGNIASEVDKMFLFQHIGSVELAIYTFALSPITRITTLLSPITTLALPKFSETSPESLKKTLPRKLLYLFLISICITIIYILLAPWFYKLVFPKYIDSIIYSQVLGLSILFFPQKVISTALTAHKQKKALYVINTLGPIIKIIVLIILLPLFGIWGVIFTLLLSRLFNGLAALYYFFKM